MDAKILPSSGRALNLFHPFAYRNFTFYWIIWLFGQSVQVSFLFLATIQTYKLTNSIISAGILNSFYSIPQLLIVLFAGVLTDSISQRKILFFINLTRLLSLLAIGASLYNYRVEVWQLYTVAAIMGTTNAFSLTVNSSILPRLVPMDTLVPANSLLSLVFRGTLIFGAVLGNEINKLSNSSFPFLIMACLCFFSIIIALSMVIRTDQKVQGAKLRAAWKKILEGFTYTKSVEWIWVTIALFSIINIAIFGPWNVGLPLLGEQLRVQYHLDVTVIYVASALGILFGVIIIGRFSRLPRPGVQMYAGVALEGLGILLIASNISLPIILSGAFLIGLGALLFGTRWAVLLQSHVPSEKLGRVGSIDCLGAWLFTPIGFWLFGQLGNAYEPISIFWVGGSITLLLSLAGFVIPSIRDL